MAIKHHFWLAAVLLTIATAAGAQSTPQTSIGELGDLNDSNLIKQALVDGATLDKKLSDLCSSIPEHTASCASFNDHATASPDPQAGSENTARHQSPPPVVRGVFGANGNKYATFLYAGGSTEDAKVGGHIPGGYLVQSLSPSVVLCDRNKHCFEVASSNTPPTDDSDKPANNGAPGGFITIPSPIQH